MKEFKLCQGNQTNLNSTNRLWSWFAWFFFIVNDFKTINQISCPLMKYRLTDYLLTCCSELLSFFFYFIFFFNLTCRQSSILTQGKKFSCLSGCLVRSIILYSFNIHFLIFLSLLQDGTLQILQRKWS